MRPAFTAAASCLGLALCALQPAESQWSTSTPDASASSNPSEAAEKHAKRTACLKEAKAEKLVGARKTAYVKDCMTSDRKPLTTSATSPAPR
jgi:hypothetical protein